MNEYDANDPGLAIYIEFSEQGGITCFDGLTGGPSFPFAFVRETGQLLTPRTVYWVTPLDDTTLQAMHCSEEGITLNTLRRVPKE